ncbi:DUF3106 domain-containing protein [Luteimonas sp. JM171]|uniref:DUF3106 domain-containing protein n=1 Tax=Luteimonas sp. JM171 TaxID=1896164 RepID=UPI000BA3598A|nr:DUF3106 domain-containing protein [Luteimonas sp. JM171]
MKIPTTAFTIILAGSLFAAPALAQPGAPLPEWDQLTPAQRDALVSTVRDRWNDAPERRERMLRHAERWQQMTPEERRSAHHGMKRWRDMSPERRERARAIYQRMRELPPEERAAMRERWKDMSAQERRAWLEQEQPER